MYSGRYIGGRQSYHDTNFRDSVWLLPIDVCFFPVAGDHAYDDIPRLQELPSYARPRFLRFLSDMDITGTFKHQKGTGTGVL